MNKKLLFIVFLLSLLTPCALWAQPYEKVVIQINGNPLLIISEHVVDRRLAVGVDITSVPYQQQRAQESVNGFWWHLLGRIYSAGSSFVDFLRGNWSWRESSELLRNLMIFAQGLGSQTLTVKNRINGDMRFSLSSNDESISFATGSTFEDWLTIFEASQSSSSPINVLLNPQCLSRLTSFVQGSKQGNRIDKIECLRIPQSGRRYWYEHSVTMSFSESNNELVINLEGIVPDGVINQQMEQHDNRTEDDSNEDGFGKGANLLIESSPI